MLKQAKKILLETEIAISDLVLIGLFVSLSIGTAWASGITSLEVITLANQSRTAAGLTVLSENKDLSQAASAKAQDMIKNDYFAHTSPAGVSPWYWMKQAGYSYKYAGENLAINYSNAEEQHTAWMKSATHRANILNPRYQEIGVATVEGKIDGEKSIVTVELFGAPLPAVADKSRSVAPPVLQPAPEAVIPEVKGFEIAVAPLAVPTAIPQVTPAIVAPSKIQLFISWVKTLGHAIKIALIEQFWSVQKQFREANWRDVAQTTTIVFLMLSLLLGPLAFLYKAVEKIVQVVRENGSDKGIILNTTGLSQSILGTLPRGMKQDTRLIHDIRPG